jgi:hypothetical protein
VRRFVLVLAVVLGTALVAEAPAGVVGQQADAAGKTEIAISAGDPLWDPTAAQFQAWVNSGINAAAAEENLLTIDGVGGWVYQSADGAACGDGHLHFAMVLAPEFVGAISGWEAAWDEALWRRILVDQDSVAAGVAAMLRREHTSRDLKIIFAIRRDDIRAPLKMRGAVYYLGGWRNLTLDGKSSASDYASDAPSRGTPDREWAARYALAGAISESGLSEPGSTQIVEGRLPSKPTRGPEGDLTSRVSSPGYGTTLRFVIGTPEELAWIDFR